MENVPNSMNITSYFDKFVNFTKQYWWVILILVLLYVVYIRNEPFTQLPNPQNDDETTKQ